MQKIFDYNKPLTELKGQIERITFNNDQNGYTVARVKVYGRPDLITVVGNMTAPSPGEIINMQGEWVCNAKYGEQFQIIRYQTSVPATLYGIRKYLGSGMIKGIGPIIAERITGKFGENSLNIIETNAERLNEVEGIGEKRVRMIKQAWNDQKEIRNIMLFLQNHGVNAGYAVKIFKAYGQDAVSIVQKNPYQMAMDIFGIGFITADKIAEKLGFTKNAPERAKAGVLYALQKTADEGHVYYPYKDLIQQCMELLETVREVIVDGIAALILEKYLVIEDLNEDLAELKENHKAVYLAKFHLCETRIARRLKDLVRYPRSVREVDATKATEWAQTKLGLSFAQGQREAVYCALKSKVMVITGGPGVGKTTIIKAVLEIFRQLKAEILLAAPTGRAAKRMTETTGHEAKTIHRLLAYNFKKGGFTKNQESPLVCDLLIIDEASMIDTVLMHHLLKAVPLSAALILVGDINQLPSVGPGNVLEDIISSGLIPAVKLTHIFRQAEQSRIVVNAHRIVNGIMPIIQHDNPNSDFYFIEKQAPEEVLQIILTLVKERIPKRFGLEPVKDIQVLTPMNRGLIGAANLNKELREALNPPDPAVSATARDFRTGDKIMQIRNNYEKEVFNGDIGRITEISSQLREVTVCFDSREIIYDFSELDELTPAYAITIHKSQGSEYPAVVIPITTQHYMLLQRNLIYTAVTRGRQLTVLVGTPKALAIAVKNDTPRRRFTRLATRLCDNQ